MTLDVRVWAAEWRPARHTALVGLAFIFAGLGSLSSPAKSAAHMPEPAPAPSNYSLSAQGQLQGRSWSTSGER